ncbi:MAG: AAA family ATPase [Thermoplasmata archaeon]|nr:MAG: AAA family ATPase [Thermoplasmata archaeon]
MYVEREITQRFRKIAEHYGVVAVVGPRQAGKTTFLKEMIKGVNASYVLFDDPDARELFEADVKKFRMQYLDGYDIGVLDEIQYCKNAGINLKYLVDTGSKLWITSSSEILLRKEVLSYLVGRVSIIRLYPFSFTEFLRAKRVRSLSKGMMKRFAWEHILYGGFPRIVLTDDIEMKKVMLRDLYETMILKDVARTFSLNDIEAVERVVTYLAINTCTVLSYTSICKHLDISFQTLKKYLDALEKSYFIKLIRPFFTNKTKEITKQPKVCFIDTGLRNVIVKQYPNEPNGRLFENYVFAELIKAGFTPKYWRTKAGAEVDFVVEVEGEIIPVEVKLTSELRADRSLMAFIERYRPQKAFVVTYAGDCGEIEARGCKIKFVDVGGLSNAMMRY